MKKLVLRLLLFLSIPLIYFAVNFSINYKTIQKRVPHIKGNVLIIGDSHPQKGIDPEVFKSARNNSQSAEPYIITYYKLKRILTKNNKIDTLIIGLSHHNISAFNDLKFKDKRWSNEMMRRSYTIIPFKILMKLDSDIKEYLKVIFYKMCLYTTKRHIWYMGRFSKADREKMAYDANQTIERHFYTEKKMLGVSETSISYLDSIIHLAREKEINVFLVSTPVHKSYFEQIPEKFKKSLGDLKAAYRKDGISIVDFTEYKLSDEYYFNSDHLNYKGANLITKRLNEEIKNN